MASGAWSYETAAPWVPFGGFPRADTRDCVATLKRMVDRFWAGYPDYVRDTIVRKTSFQFRMLQSRVEPGSTVCDVGGGWGAFAWCAAAMGMRSILMDDFGDPGAQQSDLRSQLPLTAGVSVIQRDILKEGVDFPDGSIDAFTSFDVLEHLHASPKGLLHQMMRALRQGGTLLIGVPNCVNLRKRLSVLMGRAKWSSMSDWYEAETFRSHVREPDLDDLRYIGRDLGLRNVQIRAANFMGYENASRPLRALARLADRPLRLRPSLCSDLYLIGQKA